ncbi:ferredoxin [Kitasatospora herbaricolor]|uniref:ferredoxin n=1 Tax=Kitasatospora herbaricolor TaxID=68217 RepID=UPI00174B825C|nr:ferredoxin [Kitasatospora herbaricolor]MDQ0306402.1 ferredoxin [Kitasatospora herbaricolor]GGV42546.1 ferredoxin [Kitasatospora herbaricolor]
MQVILDQDRCCSSGQCVLTAPEVFGQSDEDGLVTLRRARPEPGLYPDVRLAAVLCPGGAITVEEATGTP